MIRLSCIYHIYNYNYYIYTLEPLIKEPPNKGHNRNNLSIKDTS